MHYEKLLEIFKAEDYMNINMTLIWLKTVCFFAEDKALNSCPKQLSGIASIYLKLAVLATADICDLSRQTVIANRQIMAF